MKWLFGHPWVGIAAGFVVIIALVAALSARPAPPAFDNGFSSAFATEAEATSLVTVESCGEHPKISGSKIAGAFLSGTVKPDDSNDCIVRFARARANPPHCVVTWRDSLSHMHYDVTKDYIIILQTKASVLIDFKCSDD